MRASPHSRDHPRSRGVYDTEGRRRDNPTGSSPLARGLPVDEGLGGGGGGIIPARAGFTTRRSCQPDTHGDHPRSRGVYEAVTKLAASQGGSSPLARGLPRRRQAKNTDNGIIPARAGFTTGSFSTAWRARGSSPLARGLLRPAAVRDCRRRIIPARAGFTLPVAYGQS